MVHGQSVVCNLSGAELQQRKGSLHAEFQVGLRVDRRTAGTAISFALPETGRPWPLIADLIGVERESVVFDFSNGPSNRASDPFSLRVTGPTGAKEFLKSTLA